MLRFQLPRKYIAWGNRARDNATSNLFELLDLNDKLNILKICYKLQQCLSIKEEFSRRVQDVRRDLVECSKQNRSQGDKASVVFNEVEINGQLY